MDTKRKPDALCPVDAPDLPGLNLLILPEVWTPLPTKAELYAAIDAERREARREVARQWAG